MTTLSQTQIEDRAIQGLLAAPKVRRFGRQPFLRRHPRTVAVIAHRLRRTLAGLGYAPESISAIWRDVRDMAELEELVQQ